MAANPLDYYGPAPTDQKGVLSQWVQQPSDNMPHETQDNITWHERWKGPFSLGKDILSKIAPNDKLEQVHTALGTNRVKRYDPPTCPTRWGKEGVWTVNSVNVQEQESGAHCILDIEYYANYNGWDVKTLVENLKYNVWSLTWQSYSVSPYAFCSDKAHEDKVQSPVGKPDTPTYTEENACRQHIQTYLDKSYAVLSSAQFPNDNVYVYQKDPLQQHMLNALTPAEGVILEKVMSNKNATYHYPILTHQTVKTGSSDATYTDDVGKDIDYVIDIGKLDCPYKFPAEEGQKWDWIKIGDDMEQKKTETQVQFTRKEIFMGVHGVDLNFYGDKKFSPTKEGLLSSRWEIGKL